MTNEQYFKISQDLCEITNAAISETLLRNKITEGKDICIMLSHFFTMMLLITGENLFKDNEKKYNNINEYIRFIYKKAKKLLSKREAERTNKRKDTPK